MRPSLGAVMLYLLAITTDSASAAEQRMEVKTSRGVAQPFSYEEPQSGEIKANLILFEGGLGFVGLYTPGLLETTYSMYAKDGYAVVLVSPPSDRLSNGGLSTDFRTSSKHVQDIESLISWLEEKNHQPVWLVGVSLGTLSATYVASHTKKNIAGVILFSSKTQGRPSVFDNDLERINVPVLVVAHAQDTCQNTPPSAIGSIYRALKNSPRKTQMTLKGGSPFQSRDPCIPGSYHTFTGMEDEVVQRVSEFVESKNSVN